MKKIGVITDSHSGITQKQAKELDIMVLPMPFYFDEECYYEDVNLSREEFFQRLDSGSKVATSQPSPADVMKLWEEGLEKYEQIIYLPISSGLSGSCEAALAMAQEPPYEGRIFVVDNGRVSTALHRSVLDALELIEEGYTAPQIKEILEESRDKMVIYVGVETLEHLKRGGRISPATAALGTVLNIKPVLKFDVGTLDTFKKCHGFSKARKAMIEAMQHDLNTTFREWKEKGEVYLLAASSSSKEATEEWVQEIREAFPGMEILCDDLSMGVSCHIGQGGLGIGCSCRPKRK
ncbi:DegV family EDD domain-containing protein [Lachnospiraceae bacterium 3-1]|nr:DegV family EDD domain-containing protein [Lachnospiraceae bacterium 3-1]